MSFVSVLSTITVAAAAGLPVIHSINRPAALTFAALVLPVIRTLSGATPVVVLVHLSAGTLNFVVTLLAAFAPNTHPPNPVFVAFAVSANRSPATRSPAEGPVWAKAGTVPLTASSNDPSTATVAPTLRSMRTGTPPWLCVPAVAAIFFHRGSSVNASEMRTEH